VSYSNRTGARINRELTPCSCPFCVRKTVGVLDFLSFLTFDFLPTLSTKFGTQLFDTSRFRVLEYLNSVGAKARGKLVQLHLRNNAISMNPVPLVRHLKSIAVPPLNDIFGNINLSISLKRKNIRMCTANNLKSILPGVPFWRCYFTSRVSTYERKIAGLILTGESCSKRRSCSMVHRSKIGLTSS